MLQAEVGIVWWSVTGVESDANPFWPPVSGPSPVNDQAPVLASVSVVPTVVSASVASCTPLLLIAGTLVWIIVTDQPGIPAVSSDPRLTFASSPCTSVYLVPEIVKFLKLA